MSKMKGKSVLITGGASGIGLCTAERFAKAGCRIIITDINPQAIRTAEGKLRESGAEVVSYHVDVTDRDAVNKMAGNVIERFGGLDILINNAGIGLNRELVETTFEDWEKLINVNIWGVLHNIYAFIPSMKERRSGQIVNVASGQVFFRLPTWGAYVATKMAVSGMSEILHYELKKYDIDVTTVFPYLVNTGFYSEVAGETLGAKLSMDLLPYYSQKPETVGRLIFKAVKKRKAVEMCHPFNTAGFYARFVPYLPGVMSTVSDWALSKSAKGVEA